MISKASNCMWICIEYTFYIYIVMLMAISVLFLISKSNFHGIYVDIRSNLKWKGEFFSRKGLQQTSTEFFNFVHIRYAIEISTGSTSQHYTTVWGECHHSSAATTAAAESEPGLQWSEQVKQLQRGGLQKVSSTNTDSS